jgi:uncharacterized protein DUF6582
MAKLTSKKRKRLKKSSFAIPGKKKYPIHDKAHARNALSRVAQHGSSAQKKAVRAKVCKKYPGMSSCKKRKRK